MKKFKLFLGPAALALFLLAGPMFFQNTSWSFLNRLLGLMGLYVLLVLGVNMVLGYVGMLDLGFMAFYGIGAYTAALLTLRGWNFWLVLPTAVFVTVGVRALLGAPVLRLKGDYLAIVTLGFGEITRIALNNWDSLTNGPKGVSLLSGAAVAPIRLLGFAITTNLHFYYLILFFVGLALLICHRLNHSRIGRAWLAIRENELAAECMGVPVTRMKLVAFTFSAGFAGVAGALFVRWENFVTPESFTFWESVLLVAMVVLGGVGSLPGVMLGVVLILGLPELLRAEFFRHVGGDGLVKARYLIFGALLVAVTLFRPQGLWPRREKTS